MAGYLTVKDIAERMEISPLTVENWIREGFLKGESSGDDLGDWQITEDDFKGFIAHHQANQAAASDQ